MYMFSFAMTSGLASDSDKFKIIITLRRAQEFGDTGPYKNFDFLFNPHMPDVFCNFSLNLESFIKDAGHICDLAHEKGPQGGFWKAWKNEFI